MNQKFIISITLLVFLVFLGMYSLINVKPVLAAANDTVTIDVNVTELSSITVLPSILNWTSVSVGTQSVDIKNLTIKNTGSVNLSQIYAYVDTLTTEPVRPYGLAYPKNYSAGGVITLRNETDTQFYFAGRTEWNWTQDIPNHDWTAVTIANAKAWGYFRNASNEYVWVIGNGTDGWCNNSATKFAIEDDPDVGTIGTRTPDATSVHLDYNDSSWTYFSINRATAPLNFSCVATYYDCSKIYVYKFDKRTSPDFERCSSSDYVFAENLVPGYSFILLVDPWIPLGYPRGYLNTTTLTVYATSA